MTSASTELRLHAPRAVALTLVLGLTTAFRPLPPGAAPFADEVVSIEWSTVPETIYAGQTFDLSFDVLVLESAGLLQLFPQVLDLPLQIEAFGRVDRIGLAPPATVTSDDQTATSAGAIARATVVVDGDVVTAVGPFALEGDADGIRRYRVTRQAHVYRAGLIELAAPTARYATATAFREDLVRGRVPVDRSEQTARGAATSLEVISLPRDGCPVTYDGAVGTFELSLAVEPRAARVGDTVRLSVHVAGATPMHGVPAPRVDAGDDVDILGTSRRAEDDGTTFVFELAFRTTTPTETPAVTLTAFDPDADPPGYFIHTVPALPVAIRAPAPETSPRMGQGTASTTSPPDPGNGSVDEPDEDSRPKLIWTPLVLGGILSLAFLSRLRRRRLRDTPPS